jgi:hypothetical protein
MRIDACPRGEKCAYTKWLLAMALAVAALFLSSLSGGANMNAHAQTISNTQTTSQTPCASVSTSAPNIDIDIAGPSLLGFYRGGDFGLFGFGLVQSLTEMMVNANTGSGKTNTLNDPNQFAQSGSAVQGGPCMAVATKK